MRIYVLLLIASCVPPNGSWSAWGPAGHSTTATGPSAGQPPPPPPRPDLVATGATKQLQRLTHDDDLNELEVTPSPDGRWLLYTSSIPGELGPQASRIMRSRADGRGGVMLTKEAGFSWSASWLPNGASYVAVSNAMGGRSILKALRVAPNAAVSRVLSDRDVTAVDAVQVSPDGKRIAFHSQVAGVWTIGVSRIDGSELTHLVAGSFPSWSPDGQRLAFHRHVHGRWQLFITDTEGAELTQVGDGSADDEAPTWSPDGKLLAFVSNRGWERFPGAAADTVRNLHTIRSDGSGLIALTDGARTCARPSWGRDGKIYFSSNDAGSHDIWRLEPDRQALDSAQ
jgi:Tol biopolymer transport system component